MSLFTLKSRYIISFKVFSSLKNLIFKIVIVQEKNSLNGNGMSFNAWEAASLGSDAQTEKFRRRQRKFKQ